MKLFTAIKKDEAIRLFISYNNEICWYPLNWYDVLYYFKLTWDFYSFIKIERRLKLDLWLLVYMVWWGIHCIRLHFFFLDHPNYGIILIIIFNKIIGLCVNEYSSHFLTDCGPSPIFFCNDTVYYSCREFSWRTRSNKEDWTSVHWIYECDTNVSTTPALPFFKIQERMKLVK